MPAQNTSRRLPSPVINQDLESYSGLSYITDYSTTRQEASAENLQQTHAAMMACRQKELQLEIQLKAAIDESRQAEWEFHNAVLAMKEFVRGQYGSDSNEAQAIGLKKKSERKRPTRKAAVPSV
ncbi:MAG: hypothetical protein VKL39_18880 [Leptolyngbyaceae bacterium]|nr:hypothetical protein [Leptolyngbyaceae bacterium]